MAAEKLSVTVRPASAGDTPRVMELTAQIWGGHDYVPHAWADWLADPQGGLVVAEWQGRVVGLSKLSVQPSGDGWLHGLRVDPQFQGHGVAAALHDYLVAEWDARGGGQLRLVTRSDRLTVQHLCERTGFVKTGEFTSFSASTLPPAEQTARFTRLDPGEAGQALETAVASPFLSLSWRLVDEGWEWSRPTVQYFRQAIEQGNAWWRRDAGGRQDLLVLGEDDEDEEKYPVLLAAACPLDELPTLLVDFRRLAGELGYSRCSWTAPLRPDLAETLSAAGFERGWEHSALLYTRS